jgi:hypothetical protein
MGRCYPLAWESIYSAAPTAVALGVAILALIYALTRAEASGCMPRRLSPARWPVARISAARNMFDFT